MNCNGILKRNKAENMYLYQIIVEPTKLFWHDLSTYMIWWVGYLQYKDALKPMNKKISSIEFDISNKIEKIEFEKWNDDARNLIKLI